MIICHQGGYAVCLKTTTKTDFYKNAAELMAGCVSYKAGEIALFEEDTLIQPENQFPISHANIAQAQRTGQFEIIGQLPADFRDKLIAAINASVRLDSRRRERLLNAIAAP